MADWPYRRQKAGTKSSTPEVGGMHAGEKWTGIQKKILWGEQEDTLSLLRGVGSRAESY